MKVFTINYVANGQPMQKSTLANAEVYPFDDSPQDKGVALFKSEDDAQQAAADYEYYCIGNGGEPADIVIGEYDGPTLVATHEVY